MRRVVQFGSVLASGRMYNGRGQQRGGRRSRRDGRTAAPSDSGQDRQSFGPRVEERGGRGRWRGKRARRQNEEASQLSPHRDLAWYRSFFGHCNDRELEEEQLQVKARLETWSLERLLREGYTLIHCRARFYGRLFDKRIVRFSQPSGTLEQHVFSQGDIVTISRSSPLESVDAEGVVYEKRASFLSVVFEQLPPNVTQIEWRLDKGTNKVAYERMQRALTEMCCVNHVLPLWLRPCLLPSALVHLTPEQQKDVTDVYYIQKATLLGSNAIEGNSQTLAAAATMLSKVPRQKEHIDCALGLQLNESQLRAIENGLESRLSLIQGPPGTGKTSTAVHLIKAWRAIHGEEGPILATAQSNVAVDQLLSGCLKLQLDAVRLGQPVRVTEQLQGRTLDALLQQHPRMAEAEDLRNEIQSIRSRRGFVSGAGIGLMHRDLGIKNRKLQLLMDEISKDVVSSADVVCATCIGAGSDLLKGAQFKFIVLDESTQCTEPESLVPLMKAKRDASVVLIGDHQQLPPTVLSRDADTQRILGVSLFQRLAAVKEQLQPSLEISSALGDFTFPTAQLASWKEHVEPFLTMIKTTMLREQYRMHPVLSHWPSQRFYNGWLRDAVSERARLPPTGLPWRLQTTEDGERLAAPLLFVSCRSGQEGTHSNSQSKYNTAEAQVVVSVVNRLVGEGAVQPGTIGIISPYTAQVQTIKSALLGAGHSTVQAPGPSSEDGPGSFVEVKTVDGYQGREKDVIIFSAVRSNPDGAIGFLNDYRRFNVAMTRARRGLIIIGDPDTLRHDPLWRDWLHDIFERKFCIDARHILQ